MLENKAFKPYSNQLWVYIWGLHLGLNIDKRFFLT